MIEINCLGRRSTKGESSILVSACLITRNHARYIRRCLESMVEQAGEVAMEIVVGDDCSDDGTSAIIAEFAAAYPDLITHIRHDPRVGGSENYLSVLRRAKGAFIAHLDGDDSWMPGKLRLQAEYLAAHPDCAAVYANSLAVNEQGEPLGRFNDAPGTRFELSDLVRHGNFLNTSSMMFRASLRQMILDIDGPVLDFRIHLRLARWGYLAQLPEPLAAYRVNSIGSMVALENDFVRELYWNAILDVPRDRVEGRDLARGMADFLRRVAFRALRTRRLELLRTWMPRVFAASPYGRIRTALLVIILVAQAAYRELAGRFRKDSNGRARRVIYHY